MIPLYIQRIKEIYPSLHINDAKRIEIGQNNDVFILNRSLVFRFPKYEQGLERLKRETKLLEFVNKKTSLSIPNPIFQSFDEMKVGKTFMGYQLIEGSPLWRDEFHKIGDRKLKESIASKLVTFLIELHTMKLPITIISPMQHESIHNMIEELFVRIKEKLFLFMRMGAQEKVEDIFKTFLNNQHNFKQSFIHGDFGASNIIWDPVECRVKGIIDFGGSGYGDPAYDFAGILSSYGEEFFEMCINMYPGGGQLLERVLFYRNTFALQEALHGVEHDDLEAFENGIKEFR